MGTRRVGFSENNLYHVFTKSIAGFDIFRKNADYKRMVQSFSFFSNKNIPCKFALLDKITDLQETIYSKHPSENIVSIIAYCLMPTHLHLILREMVAGGISKFMNRILSSHTHYFNPRYNRKGPLWESRFKNLLIEDDSYLLHLTRYIHLNPVTANLVEQPEDWEFSSYGEYIDSSSSKICKFSQYLDINKESYKNFVHDHIGHQKAIALIKHLAID